jgi:hypothetical protein
MLTDLVRNIEITNIQKTKDLQECPTLLRDSWQSPHALKTGLKQGLCFIKAVRHVTIVH